MAGIGLHKARGRSNANQPGDGPGAGPQHARLAADDPFHDGPGQIVPAAAAKCVAAKALERDRVGLQRAAGIEAEPADPQQRRADDRVGQIVRRHRFAAVAQPAADQQRADQRRNSRTDMHDRAAGEIERSARRPAVQMRRAVLQDAAAPNPMASGQ